MQCYFPMWKFVSNGSGRARLSFLRKLLHMLMALSASQSHQMALRADVRCPGKPLNRFAAFPALSALSALQSWESWESRLRHFPDVTLIKEEDLVVRYLKSHRGPEPSDQLYAPFEDIG